VALSKITNGGITGMSVSSTDVTVSSGDLLFGTAAKGVCLGVTSNTDSNTFDDYEEGTWTPTLGGTGSDPTVSYDHQIGWYVKIGNIVHFGARLQWNTSGSSGGSGDATIKTLPFASGGDANLFTGVGFVKLNFHGFDGNFSANRDYIDLMIKRPEARLLIMQLDYDNPDVGTYTNIGISQCIAGDAQLDFSGAYTI
jgi:hypothetical protein